MDKKMQRSFDNAVVSVSMEGYVFTKEQIKMCEDVLDGRMSKDELINSIKNKAKELRN